jgi:hypothetical protein
VNPPGRVLLGSLCLSATLLSTARGQTAQATQTSSAPASQSSTQSASGQQIPPANKKVWTNDDVGDLRDHSAITTIGGANAKPANPSERPLAGAKAKDTQWYRDQILKLQAKVPPLDDKIHQLEAALNGETVNSVRTYGGVRADDWRDQLSRLQKQRGDILAKIDALQDEARHNGVPPNKLP